MRAGVGLPGVLALACRENDSAPEQHVLAEVPASRDTGIVSAERTGIPSPVHQPTGHLVIPLVHWIHAPRSGRNPSNYPHSRLPEPERPLPSATGLASGDQWSAVHYSSVETLCSWSYRTRHSCPSRLIPPTTVRVPRFRNPAILHTPPTTVTMTTRRLHRSFTFGKASHKLPFPPTSRRSRPTTPPEGERGAVAPAQGTFA